MDVDGNGSFYSGRAAMASQVRKKTKQRVGAGKRAGFRGGPEMMRAEKVTGSGAGGSGCGKWQ